jgi:hypothetical protein
MTHSRSHARSLCSGGWTHNLPANWFSRRPSIRVCVRGRIWSFGSQAGSQEDGRRRLAADVGRTKVQVEGCVRTSADPPGRHGMQEVREFDSPRLHRKVQVRRGAAAPGGAVRSSVGHSWGHLLWRTNADLHGYWWAERRGITPLMRAEKTVRTEVRSYPDFEAPGAKALFDEAFDLTRCPID